MDAHTLLGRYVRLTHTSDEVYNEVLGGSAYLSV